MKNINATLLVSEETLRPYLILEDFFEDEDGTETITIESDGVGFIGGDNCMDLPGCYYLLTPESVDDILKNDGQCKIRLDESGKIKRVEDKVVIVSQ
jgi:hypothetical protein